jgi:hypothetical protein
MGLLADESALTRRNVSVSETLNCVSLLPRAIVRGITRES